MNDEAIYATLHGECALWHIAEVRAMKLAGDILNEPANTENHANRVIWANAVLANPTVKIAEMKTHILLNATIGAAPESATSADVEFVISGLINLFAKG